MGIKFKTLGRTPANTESLIFKDFSDKHSLVYQYKPNDSYDNLPGITKGARVFDYNLVQGASQGHDITLLQRLVPIYGVKGQFYKWTVLQVTVDADLHHLFIDGHRHPNSVYRSTFSAFEHYNNQTHLADHNLGYFGNYFNVYSDDKNAMFIPQILTKGILGLIYNHGANLDYEFDGHNIRVLNLTPTLNSSQLEDMFILAQNLVQLVEASQL